MNFDWSFFINEFWKIIFRQMKKYLPWRQHCPRDREWRFRWHHGPLGCWHPRRRNRLWPRRVQVNCYPHSDPPISELCRFGHSIWGCEFSLREMHCFSRTWGGPVSVLPLLKDYQGFEGRLQMCGLRRWVHLWEVHSWLHKFSPKMQSVRPSPTGQHCGTQRRNWAGATSEP